MKPIDKNFLQSIKEFDDNIIKYVKARLFPAFKGLTFGAAKCEYDNDDEGSAAINGIIYADEKHDTTYHYTIILYPQDNLARINVTKFYQGNLCRISDTDHWKINEDNISKKKIKELVNTLNAKEADYRAKHYGE